MSLHLSFEVFPPKGDHRALAATCDELARHRPDFVSVTYGAGGGDRDRSFAAIETVAATGLPVAAHLTCVGQSRADVDGVIDRFRSLGVDHVVALRGDPPEGVGAPYHPHADGHRSTVDLVAATIARGVSHVTVSAYPEIHPQSPSLDHDLDLLAAKVDAGADRAITQMCFDVDTIVRYAERVEERGIDVALTAGVFPIHSFPAVARFAGRCGASIPEAVAERFAGLDDDPETTRKLGAELAAEHIERLADHGIDHVHLYTLNRADLAGAVLDRLRAGVVR